MHQVTVLPDRYIPGWSGDVDALENGDVELVRSMPLDEALTTHWDTDAHFAPYVVPDDERCPRLNKSAVSWFEEHAPGYIPELRAMAVDVDLPDHGAGDYGWQNRGDWPPAWNRWYERIQEAIRTTPELRQAGTYLTRGGMRFVWPLAEDRIIPVTVADSYIEQFYDYLEDRGLPLDRTDEWNRLFRLPRVVRDDVFQTLPMELQSMRPLEWRAPETLAPSTTTSRGTAARDEMPDPGALDDPNLSDLNDFEDEWFYHHLRNELPLAEPGNRHDAVLQAATAIVNIRDTNDPVVPFQLIAPTVRAMQNESPDGRPYWDEVWSECVWACETYDGHRRARENEERSLLAEQAEAMGCEPDDVRDRLILATKAPPSYFVWDEHRAEYVSPTSNQSLLETMLSQHCPELSLIDLREDTSSSSLVRDLGRTIDGVTMSYSAESTYYDEDMDRVVQSVIQQDPHLRPRFDEHIDQWLRLIFADRTDRGLDWLATFTELDAATCALYIHGPADIGKGLLARGLARLWRETPVPYKELMEDFQASLTKSPLVLADEQVPTQPFQNSGSSIFRRFIGTGGFRINRKHKPKVDLRGFPRILITANSADALQIDEALEEADIEAIRQRIGYIRTDNSAGEYLREYAHSRDMTAREVGNEWVDGGGIAQHVLWLAENREVDRGDRFLVEGWESELTKNMGVTFGSAPLIGKYICRVIRDKESVRAIRYGEDEELFVNLDYIRQSWNRIMGQSSRVPGDQSMMKALRVLSEGERKRMRPDDGSNHRYYWKIDADKIARIAEEFYVTDAQTIEAAVKSASGSDVSSEIGGPNSGLPMEALEGGGS